MVNAKSLHYGKKTATIKLEFSRIEDKATIKALYALIGGYNAVGRDVSLDCYERLKEQLEAAVNDMSYAMAVAQKGNK